MKDKPPANRVVYARLETTTNEVLRSSSANLRLFKNMDVQTYRDKKATQKFGRFTVGRDNPKYNRTKTTMLDCVSWNVVWLPPKHENVGGKKATKKRASNSHLTSHLQHRNPDEGTLATFD